MKSLSPCQVPHFLPEANATLKLVCILKGIQHYCKYVYFKTVYSVQLLTSFMNAIQHL